MSGETKRKISATLTGRTRGPRSEEWKRKLSKALTGRKCREYEPLSEEHKRKISETLTGIKRGPMSEETKRKIVKSSKGHPGPIISEEVRLRMSLAISGPNHPNWKGGLSFLPYCLSWTEISQYIKERDNYICQECGATEELRSHHIDYDKQNCDPSNLICLCNSCNMKANYNRRNWIWKYTHLITERLGHG